MIGVSRRENHRMISNDCVRNMGICFLVTLTLFMVYRFISVSPDDGESSDYFTTQSSAYPHQPLYHNYNRESNNYSFIMVADPDKSSKVDTYLWKSKLIYGQLSRTKSGKYEVKLLNEKEVQTTFSEAGRSLELSDVCNFNGKLYTFDDRTGLVYIITNEKIYPETILMDGSGHLEKGFKGEWCTVKDDKLFIGGMGKEWTDEHGNFVNNNPLWIKTIDRFGRVEHFDWHSNYEELRKATGTQSPGYLLHEAVVWQPSTQQWLFFPRRLSKEKYDAILDEYRCSNTLISANEHFTSVTTRHDIGELEKTRGFSSAKFIPFRENEIALLKTEELNGTKTYIMIFDLNNGQILLPETLISSEKLEGFEFI